MTNHPSIISSLHCHSHLITLHPDVKFIQRNFKNKSYTYTQVAWSEESTSTVYRLKTYSVQKHGVLEAFKLAMDFRNKLIEVKEQRMKLFVARVRKEMSKEIGNCKA
jgi:pyruvate formate-lyase activating enzyme-like uncharacterized protein